LCADWRDRPAATAGRGPGRVSIVGAANIETLGASHRVDDRLDLEMREDDLVPPRSKCGKA